MADPVALDQFLPYVLPWANGVSYATAVNAIRQAAITFCQKTLIWRGWIQPISVVANQGQVAMYAGPDAQVWLVLDAWLDGRELKPRNEDALRHANIRPNDPPGQPWVYTFHSPATLELLPIPNEASASINGLQVRAAIMPTRGAAMLPAFLYDGYAREIADGALSLLHASAETYAQPAQFTLFSGKFDAAINTTALRAAQSDTRSPLRVKPCWN